MILALRVLALDRAERGRRGEEALAPCAPRSPARRRRHRACRPACPRTRWSCSRDQRRVADVGVAHHPAHVGGRPVHLARLDAVDVLHRPVAAPPRGRRCRAPRPWAGRWCRRCRGCRAGRSPSTGTQSAGSTPSGTPCQSTSRPATSSATSCSRWKITQNSRLVRRLLDRAVEQRLVVHDPPRLDAAGGGDDHLGLAVVDPHRQLVRREAAEDHRVHRADPGAGEHRHQRLGHHRHVDDDPVALLHAARRSAPASAATRSRSSA